jgi:branched-chain amino acid aminotransferase
MKIKVMPLEETERRSLPEGDLGFGSLVTNRMFRQSYNPDEGWHDAAIVPYGPLALYPATAVFHYAQEIFEGTKAYRRSDGNINLFRPWENMKRFNDSARRMAMPVVDEEEHLAALIDLIALDQEWVPDHSGSALYIRPVMIGIDNSLGVHASSNYLHYIILSPVGSYFKEGFNPVPVYISHVYRRAVLGGTGAAKTGGNYAASLLAGREAQKEGYSQVLWLDAIEGRYVEEVGAMNICFVYDGNRIVTPPLTGSILPGITRDSVITLARDLSYDVSEQLIDVNEMLADVKRGKVSEVFGCGTAAIIAPVGKFGYQDEEYVINDYEVGPVAAHLYKELTDIQYGRIPDRFNWIHTIEANGN